MNSFEKARRYFTETIIQAPSFAPAHVALAEAWLEAAPALPPAAQQAAFQQARRAAESALAVDADVPQAHSALGWISLQHTRNPSRAARFFERETEQHPDGDRHLGRYLSARGQHGDAMAVMARHVAAEPASKTARLALAEVFYRARQYTDALRELERVQDLDGDDVDVARLRMDVLSALGHHSEALQACQRDLELSGDRSPTSSDLGSAFARGGLLGARRLMFQQLVHSVAPPPDPVRLAQLSARIGEPGASLAWLDQADQERRGDLVWLDVDPAYDTLRSVPRFHSLLERLGLDPTPGS
jgi:tetratricopeptide (TPR) repeat protein